MTAPHLYYATPEAAYATDSNSSKQLRLLLRRLAGRSARSAAARNESRY